MAHFPLTHLLLKPITTLLTQLTTPPLSPQLFHALRVSIIYNSRLKSTNKNVNWRQRIFGYLIMVWGGLILTHTLLLFSPSPSPSPSSSLPILSSPRPYITYLAPFLLLSLLPLPTLRLPSYAWIPLDALLRANSVVSSLQLTTHVSPLIVGAAASAGGSILSSLPAVAFLHGDWWDGAAADVWGGALVGWVVGGGLDDLFGLGGGIQGLGLAERKAVATYIFIGVFGFRTWMTARRAASVEKEKDKQQ